MPHWGLKGLREKVEIVDENVGSKCKIVYKKRYNEMDEFVKLVTIHPACQGANAIYYDQLFFFKGSYFPNGLTKRASKKNSVPIISGPPTLNPILTMLCSGKI